MIIKQSDTGVVMLGKFDDAMTLLKQAIEAGYGELPAVWAIKLYIGRN